MDDDLQHRINILNFVTHDDVYCEIASIADAELMRLRARCASLMRDAIGRRPPAGIIERIAAHPELAWCADYMASIKL